MSDWFGAFEDVACALKMTHWDMKKAEKLKFVGKPDFKIRLINSQDHYLVCRDQRHFKEGLKALVAGSK